MNEKPLPPLPKPIRQLQEQLNQFRLTQARRSKLPEPRWTTAAALAREYGVYAVANPLRLDFDRRPEGVMIDLAPWRVVLVTLVGGIAPGSLARWAVSP
jgi:hypothetical protein